MSPRTFLLPLCLAILSVACSSPSAPADDVSLVATLCDASEAAADGELDAAERAFGEAHDGLHTLARDLQDADRRPDAGKLLEAKQRVEAGFDTDPPAPEVPDDLRRLASATAAVSDQTPPASCTNVELP